VGSHGASSLWVNQWVTILAHRAKKGNEEPHMILPLSAALLNVSVRRIIAPEHIQLVEN